ERSRLRLPCQARGRRSRQLRNTVAENSATRAGVYIGRISHSTRSTRGDSIVRALELARHRCSLGMRALREQCLAAREAIGAPDLAALVVLAVGTRTGGQDHPRLLRLGVDVHVRREAIRIIECADAHEAHEIPETAVMTPYRDATGGAARDDL